MKTEEWKQQISKLNRPGFYLALAVSAGIIMNGMIVSYKLMPLLQQEFVYNANYNQVQRELALIEGSPVPAKATDQDIERLVRQVPTKEEISRFIVSLRELEQKSGIVLSSIRFGEDKNKQPVDELNAILNGQLKMSAPSLNGSNAVQGTQSAQPPGAGSPSNSLQAKAAAPATPDIGFQETKITLNGTGTYAQVVDFFNKVYQLERVMTVTDWQMDPTGKTVNSKGSKEPGEPLVQIGMTLLIYHAGQYAGIFPDLPAIPTSTFEPKQSPVVPDDQYLKMLDSAVGKP
ncbi:hypothetical protein ACFQI7_12885 [Paenibacillus allorhizosphaerae]|uniref:Uncharacterized protein n=1 Tax=Paenibacillus allorhizosphaerae TaxID=2849866 RepID=A0ABM8VLL6_9BACL|nr:hypothetical protein [Paenibacillus allorhizosphaerae]CAG7648259.1 hypothetical protein PAECIP111802_04164 [Paenibacillus allorhizosphaerae]